MPRFFFNIYDGQDLRDQDGQVLPDWPSAQRLAIRYAGEVLQNDNERIAPDEDWRMEVTDEAGLVLLRLDFSIMLAPALISAKATIAANIRLKPEKL